MRRKKPAREKHLERHGRSIRFVMVRAGKRILRDLETGDMSEAIRLRDYYLATGRWRPTGALLSEGLRDYQRGDFDRNAMRAVEIWKDNRDDALAYIDAAHDGLIPIVAGLELIHDRQGNAITDKTKATQLREARSFAAWLKSRGIPPDVQRVSFEDARDYAKSLEQEGFAPQSVRSKTLPLVKLFRFFNVNPNPFKFASRPVALDEGEKARAFTDEEVRRLLTGGGEPDLLAAIKIGLLTGMRVGEMLNLRVEDVRGDCLHVRKNKTRAKERKVIPVHSQIASDIARLCDGRAPGDYLFDMEGNDNSRAARFWRAFTPYRIKCGVDDRSVNQKSRVTFHSARHWLMGKLEGAGVDERIAARIAGHKFRAITYGTYSTGGAVEELRQALERVRLPY